MGVGNRENMWWQTGLGYRNVDSELEGNCLQD
jgi:hypothetical protein